jgi:RNA polymerase sigma factor (sigma-70 family)
MRSVPFDDILQASFEGLMRATENVNNGKFDKDKAGFITYANYFIRDCICDVITDHNLDSIVVKREAIRTPNSRKNKCFIGMTVYTYGGVGKEMMDLRHKGDFKHAAIDQVAGHHYRTTEPDQERITMMRAVIDSALFGESKRNKTMFMMHTTEGHTYQYIGDKYELTRERVKQIVMKITKRIKANTGGLDFRDREK